MRVAWVAALALLAACGGTEPASPFEEARAAFPTLLALHQGVIARSCAAVEGACHNNREYPDLHTPANLLEVVGRPCNAARTDAATIFDGCEPKPDELVIDASGWRSPVIALLDEEWDAESRELIRRITLEEPAAAAVGAGASARLERDGNLVLALPDNLRLAAGSAVGELVDLEALEYHVLERVHAGDPNGNGVIGARDPWALVMRGRADRSYLLGRILGAVPGDRMPRAGEPLSEAEALALACWIETLSDQPGDQPGVEDAIDYDRCPIRTISAAFSGGGGAAPAGAPR